MMGERQPSMENLQLNSTEESYANKPLPVPLKKSSASPSTNSAKPTPPPKPTIPPKPQAMRGHTTSISSGSIDSQSNIEGRGSLYKSWDGGSQLPPAQQFEGRISFDGDINALNNSNPQQKQGVCVNCSSPLIYVPSFDGVTNVKCYACPAITRFEDPVPGAGQPPQPQQSQQPQPQQQTQQSVQASDHQELTQSQPAVGDSKNKKSAEQLMKGAFKSMKAKAIETKQKVEHSQFYNEAKEKASTAATKTKAAAQKATEQTKVAAQQAKERVKDNINTIQQKIKEEREKEEGEKRSSQVNAQTPPQPFGANNNDLSHTAVFGVPVEVAVERSSTLALSIPDIVYKCIQYLHNKGVREEGIFRLSGGATQIKDLKDAFNRGEDIDLSTVKDEHVVSGLLKLWFRELPETIFTRALIPELKELEGETDHEKLILGLSQIINRLPNSNRTILEHLMQLLHTTTTYEETNKMNVMNLSIVFSPTLGAPMGIMKTLITYYEDIFHYDLIDL